MIVPDIIKIYEYFIYFFIIKKVSECSSKNIVTIPKNRYKISVISDNINI